MKSILLLGIFFLSASYANAGAGYVCVGGYLYMPNGSKSYVGQPDCQNAKLGNGYACVSGYLYMPDGNKNYVGQPDCESANFGE